MKTLRHILSNTTFVKRAAKNRTLRHMIVGGLFTVASAGTWAAATHPASSIASCHNGKVMNVVAHQDDDILFLNPDLQDAIQGGSCVRTLYVTAGDDGLNDTYWTKREAGVRAAYAVMAGEDNKWTDSTVKTDVGQIRVTTLKADSRISLAFMRLPDGDHTGAGFKLNERQSLQKLWDGTLPTINAVDKSATYTKDALVSTIAELIRSYAPDTVNTQDYAGVYGDGDHSDHHTVAYATKVAQTQYAKPHNFVGYEDYNISRKPKNVSNDAYLRKQEAFFAYAAYDPHVCDTEAVCSHFGYGAWLPRQYTLPFTIAPASITGIAIKATNNSAGPSAKNYASLQGGGGSSSMVSRMTTTIARIALPPQSVQSKHPVAKKAVQPAKAQFHMPFVGLDIPKLTDARTKENLDIYAPNQPIVVLRGWVSDNELSEATTSTV